MTAALTILPTPRAPRRFLEDDASLLLDDLRARISRQYPRNRNLSAWYAQKQIVQSLGMGVAPEFDQLKLVLGWPSTVVDKLIKRRTIDHIEVPGSAGLTERVQRIWDENDLALESRMLHTGKAIHGIHFNVIARNEGQTIVLPTSPTQMTCDYNRAQRRTMSALSIDEREKPGDVQQYTLMVPERNVVVEHFGGRYLIVNEFENPSGVVPVERFVNRPRGDKAWGSSNITPTVISLTQAAVRTLVSMEPAREAFAMPQLFLFNVAKEAFKNADGSAAAAWDMYFGRFKALTGALDEDGEPLPLQPDVKQLPASPPTPLIDLIKMYSQLLSTEVGMPPSMFGFVTDNPPSGDGQRMFESDLVLTAETDNTTDGVSWSRTMRKALLADGVPQEQIPPVVRIVWKDPATFMPAATTDAVTKQIQVEALPKRSEVGLEKMGYSNEAILRIREEWRAEQSTGLVANLAAAAQQARANTAVASLESRRANADGGAVAAVPAG